MRSGRPSPRIARIALNRPDTRSKHREPDPRRKPAFGPWVRSTGICAGCGRQGAPLEAHHESAVEDKSTLALGNKVDDALQVPLCAALNGCHDVRHAQGQLTFWGDTDIPRQLTRALGSAYRADDVDAAVRACFRASQDRVNKLAEIRRAAGVDIMQRKGRG